MWCPGRLQWPLNSDHQSVISSSLSPVIYRCKTTLSIRFSLLFDRPSGEIILKPCPTLPLIHLNISYISIFITFFIAVYLLFLYLFYFHDIVLGTDGSTYNFPLHFFFFWVYLSVHVFYSFVTLSFNILWHKNFHRDERGSLSFVPIFEEIPQTRTWDIALTRWDVWF